MGQLTAPLPCPSEDVARARAVDRLDSHATRAGFPHRDGRPGPNATSTAASAVDGVLVVAAQGGDRVAFGVLYERYVGVVWRVVLSRVGDWALAQDLTSETFARALRGICSVGYQGRYVRGWLLTIASNLVSDHFRSSRHRLEIPTATVGDVPADDGGPERAVIDKDTAAGLMRCVAQLPRRQRECVGLRFGRGLSVAETAAVMGASAGTVKALQHHGLRRLARLLGEGDGTDVAHQNRGHERE